MWLDETMKAKKEEIYRYCRETIKLMLTQESDELIKMSTISAVLKKNFPYYLWVGFYRLQRDVLLVGPYQGSPACLRIALDKGVCGKSASERKTIIVEEVGKFPGYIACDSKAKSEIVVPVFNRQDELIAVLDVDSQYKGAFDEMDKMHLQELLKEIISS